MTDPSTIEAVARAIAEALYRDNYPGSSEQSRRLWIEEHWTNHKGEARAALAAHEAAIKDAGMVVVPFGDELPPEVIDAGAQRLASFGDDSIWPDSWEASQVTQMRVLAERVIRSALVALIAASEGADLASVRGRG